MAIITISGAAGCGREEIAHLAARRLNSELVNEARLLQWFSSEFAFAPESADRPPGAWRWMASSVLARMATERSLVVDAIGADRLLPGVPAILRVALAAGDSRRTGNLMLQLGLERAAAVEAARRLDAEEKDLLRTRFGRGRPAAPPCDLQISVQSFTAEQAVEVIAAAAEARGLPEQGTLPASAEAQIQFQVRLELARHGITPAGQLTLKAREFGHPSEEIFANLLDFYRIRWEYEPRSFPLEWDGQGRVVEAFTPDFYLPEFDLFVELTTMKQSLVTRKNRKVKLLKSLYPEINIQVFYQKDMQDLVMKYGLAS